MFEWIEVVNCTVRVQDFTEKEVFSLKLPATNLLSIGQQPNR